MKVSQLRGWLFLSRAQTGDPAGGVWLVTARWDADPVNYTGDEVVIGRWGGEMLLTMNVGGELFNMPVKVGEWKVHTDGSMAHWGLEKLAPGIWAIRPSILQKRSLHAFVVFTGAPDPAPWEEPVKGLKEAIDDCVKAGLLKRKEPFTAADVKVSPGLWRVDEAECGCGEIEIDGRPVRHGQNDPRHSKAPTT